MNLLKIINAIVNRRKACATIAVVALLFSFTFFAIAEYISSILCFIYYLVFKSIVADLVNEKLCDHELIETTINTGTKIIWKGKACKHCTYEEDGEWFI